jgi:hypothetical protein
MRLLTLSCHALVDGNGELLSSLSAKPTIEKHGAIARYRGWKEGE